MTRAGIVIASGLIVGVVVTVMPSLAGAQQHGQQHRDRRGSDGGIRHHDRPGSDGGTRHHDRPGLRHRHHSPRPFVTFYSPPSVVYSTYYAPPPVYYVPPVVYPAPPVYYPAPAMSRVIEYSTGRYELHGDGVATRYEWVWIPNPPAAPPPPVEPASLAPPSAPAPSAPSGSREAFRWTDDHGVTTWTDRLESVPEQYRAQMQRLR